MLLLLAAGVATACGSAVGSEAPLAQQPTPTLASAASETTVATTEAPVAETTPPTEPPPPTTEPPPPPPPPVRPVYEQAWTPFAVVGDVVLQHPSARVEQVAFHESNHDGAQELAPLPTAANPVTLESRERGTGGRTAVDVVVDPDVEIRSPVTGRVLRSGRYVLYCRHSDDFLVVEPDTRPGWEVKMLHIDGVTVRAGDRVTAGETVVAPRPTQLPFESQVDEITTQPAWPHVHIEVVDPSIPNRPKGGSC
jgi:biotin carboxyl carrier protein